MKAFLDTSVLIATFYGDHEHHDASAALFIRQKKPLGYTAGHCLAEFYAVATAMPGVHRAGPQEALLFVQDVRERLTLIALDADEYARAVVNAAQSGISGGSIYDALIAQCALKANVHTLYTWNMRHFRHFERERRLRVRMPGRGG